MTQVNTTSALLGEIVDLFASSPSRERILAFHPSAALQQQVRELLENNRSGWISVEEQRELDQIEQVESLMQLVKARFRLQTL